MRKHLGILAVFSKMLPCLPAHATFVADVKFASETQKVFLTLFQKHFASATDVSEMFLGLRSKEAKHLF